MNPQVQFISPTAARLTIGNKTKAFLQCKTKAQLANKIKNEICAKIVRYAKHRQKALAHYGQLSHSKAYSIQCLLNRFGQPKNFTPIYLVPKIKGAKDHFYNILPAPQSCFYTNQRQLVEDLLTFATNYQPEDFGQPWN